MCSFHKSSTLKRVIIRLIAHPWASGGSPGDCWGPAFLFYSCYYLFSFFHFILMPQTAFPAGPWEKGQLQLTGGMADLYFSPQDMLWGNPIFSALGQTLPALLLLWAANHERAEWERERFDFEKLSSESTQAGSNSVCVCVCVLEYVFVCLCASECVPQQIHEVMRTICGCLYNTLVRTEGACKNGGWYKCCVSWVVVKCSVYSVCMHVRIFMSGLCTG